MNMDHATTAPLCHNRPRRGIIAWLAFALTARRHRRLLGELDRHLLKDIGLSESDAQFEANRTFWDVPAHWRR